MLALMRLTPLRSRDASLIAPKLGMKNTLDLLEGLGLRKLEPESAETLVRFLDRVGKLITKRNILVHGQWVYEANVLSRRGEAILQCQFLREIIPTDPAHAKALGNPRNQKERVRYTFSLKRIEAAIRDTNTVNFDLMRFSGEMKQKILSPAEILEQLQFSAPYRVIYPTR
jgi:hypothetical protein